MSEDDMLCTGAEECKKLEDAVHIIKIGDKEVHQRPEYCSGQRPHRFNHEECGGMHCGFINKWVECKRMWKRNN